MSDTPRIGWIPKDEHDPLLERIRLGRRGLLRGGAGTAAALALSGLHAGRVGAVGGPTGGRLSRHPQEEPQAGGALVVGLQSEPSDNIDPHVTPWAVSHNIMMNVYDTLVWQDPADGSFKPGLAETWEASEDGTLYTFTLKQGVLFHDGTPFNADAVKFAFDRIADPATKSGFSANLLGPYAGTEIVDEYTVRVSFSEPYAPFLDSASQAFLGFVSPAAVAEVGADFGVTAAVGTGPFLFKEWVRGDHLTLVKNPDYNWAGGVFMHNGPAYVDEITFRFITEDATRTGTLESGETNIIELVPETDIQILEAGGFGILPGKAPGIPAMLEINTAKPPTDDFAVRQALNLGTDQETILEAIYFGVFDRAHGPLSQVSWAYNPAVEGAYPYDPDLARQTLEEAGWTLNGDIREKDGANLEIEYIITDWDKHAELWQAQMREIGVQVNITKVDNGTWLDSGSKGAHNVSQIGWISSDPVILEHLFHSRNAGTGFNWTFVNDPRIDELVEQGKATVDQATRKELYGEVQQRIVDQALIVPMYDQIGYNGIGKEVHDVRVDARGWYRWLYDAWVEQ